MSVCVPVYAASACEDDGMCSVLLEIGLELPSPAYHQDQVVCVCVVCCAVVRQPVDCTANAPTK